MMGKERVNEHQLGDHDDTTPRLELLDGAVMWLDLKGRNEIGGIMSWVRLHDEYEKKAGPASCCA